MFYCLLENIGINNTYKLGIEMLIVAVLVFALTTLTVKLALPVLRAKKLGQNVSNYIPEHASKQGTPTMGGICFIMASLFVMLIWFLLETFGVIGTSKDTGRLIPMAFTLCLGVFNAMIGFIDDYAKLVKKQNEGLTEKQKIILQFIVAALYIFAMAITDNLTTAFKIPFTDITLNLGIFAYPLYVLVIAGFVNSTNITDGIDGLASSVTLSVAMGIVFLAAFFSCRFTGIIGATLIGATLGFLVYNHFPAKIFMGDTGSLYIGGIIMGCAIAEGELVAFVIMGMLFIIEMLTSLIQRLYFKLTHGKRLFKKAPVHHHFQELGWSETKIVTVFFIVSLLFVATGVLSCIL